MKQVILTGKDSHMQIGAVLREMGASKALMVCDASFPYLSIREDILAITVPYITFSEFTPNPLYEDVCKGVALFNSEGCDAIVAIGGGSALDVAKCIKLYAKMDHSENYLSQPCGDSGIPLIAVPTTAGTGSESTRYAVIYYEGKKQSVTHESIVPTVAVLSHGVLGTLPLYQKKCTLLDALCQGIESWWSVNSTDESKEYSRFAVETIMKYKDAYIEKNDPEAAEKIMLAANYAGRAINITQTTAAHAMSYKITSLYGVPHGHAVAMCLAPLWRYMLTCPDRCVDLRGAEYLETVYHAIAEAMGVATPALAIECFERLLCDWEMKTPVMTEEEIGILTDSVNPVRLKNHPIAPDTAAIRALYTVISQKNA